MSRTITTKLYLCNVQWNNKYSHVVNFDSVSDRRDFFINNTGLSFDVKRILERDGGSVELKVEYTTAIREKYNYMYVVEEHTGTTDGGVPFNYQYEWFAFVTAFKRNSDETTIFNYEVDFWQTYFFDKQGNKAVMDIADAFVQREHQDRWSRKSETSFYPIYSRTLEGLEVGDKIVDEQETVYQRLTTIDGRTLNVAVIPYLVIVNSNVASVFYDNAGEYVLNNYASTINGAYMKELSFLIYPKFINIDTGSPVDLSTTTIKLKGRVYDHKGLPKTYRTQDYFNAFKTGTKLAERYTLGNKLGKVDGEPIGLDSEKMLAFRRLPYLPLKLSCVHEDDVLTVWYNNNEDNNNEMMLAFVNKDDEDSPAQYAWLWNSTYALDVDLETIRYYYLADSDVGKKNKPAKIAYEPKLKTSEFEHYVITNYKSENIELFNERFANNVKIKYSSSVNFTPMEQITLEGYNDNDYYNQVRNELKNEYPLSTDAYLQYINNNRSQIVASQSINAVQTGVGIASLAFGATALATGNVLGAKMGVGMGLGLLAGGVGGTLSGASGIVNELAKQSDFKNKIDDVRANVNSLELDTKEDGDMLRITKYKVRDEYLQRAYQLFTKQGYLSNNYYKPNLESRYYYNYIKTGYVEINPNAIGEDAVRKIIESIYNNGTTIWHYNKGDCLDIMDYSINNVERSLL